MSGQVTTIIVLFFMTDTLCFTGVVCVVGLRLFLYCFLLLLMYASLMLYVWSDYDYSCTVSYDC